METRILITNLTMNGDGFGVVPETGESVYIPPGVAKASAIVTGEYRDAKLVPNTPARAAQTPLMGVFIKPAPAVVYAEDDSGTADAVLDLFEEVEDDGLYPLVLTTTNIAEALKVSTGAVRPVLDRMFRQGLLARADVFTISSPNRASMVLWAREAEDFR